MKNQVEQSDSIKYTIPAIQITPSEPKARDHSFFCDKKEKNTKFCINQLTQEKLLELFLSEDKNQIFKFIEDLNNKPIIPCRALSILALSLSNWVTQINKAKMTEFKTEILFIATYAINQFNKSRTQINAMDVAIYAQIINSLGIISPLNQDPNRARISGSKLTAIARILSTCKPNSKTLSNFISGIGLLIKYQQLDSQKISGKSLNLLIDMQTSLPIEQLEYKDLSKRFFGFVWIVTSDSLMNFGVNVRVLRKLVTRIMGLGVIVESGV